MLRAGRRAVSRVVLVQGILCEEGTVVLFDLENRVQFGKKMFIYYYDSCYTYCTITTLLYKPNSRNFIIGKYDSFNVLSKANGCFCVKHIVKIEPT